MGQLSKDRVRIVNGQVYFIPSGSVTTGASQSFTSTAQIYAVTMSGASLSQSMLAPANETASFWYLRTPDSYSFKIFYQNSSGSSIEPTGSSLGLRDLPNSMASNITGSVVKVLLDMDQTGSGIVSRTVNALKGNNSGKNRYIISSSQNFTYIHITSSINGAAIPDDISFSHISGSSFSYNVPVSGSGSLRGIISEGTPDTGSARATIKLDTLGLKTEVETSNSYMNLQDGFYGIVNSNPHTASNISLHGGYGIVYGQALPNSAYMKSINGFDFLLDSGGSYTNTQFRIFKNGGIPAIGGSTELFKIDEDGNLTTSGTIDGGTY